jgi:hypothetical protein
MSLSPVYGVKGRPIKCETVGKCAHGFLVKKKRWEHSTWCSHLEPLHVWNQAGGDTKERRHHQYIMLVF